MKSSYSLPGQTFLKYECSQIEAFNPRKGFSSRLNFRKDLSWLTLVLDLLYRLKIIRKGVCKERQDQQ